MAADKNPLTDQQRNTLRPLVDKLESACNELEAALNATGLGRGAGEEFGFCLRCPRPGKQELCSSFKGPGKTLREPCQRDFCGHPLFAHF